jgi:mRNA interferase RelE/StbE
MQVKFTKQFDKQFDKTTDTFLKNEIIQLVNDTILAVGIYDIPKIKKLKGYKTAYRVRIGDYRVGLLCENNIVVFVAIGHRKNIYKHFP